MNTKDVGEITEAQVLAAMVRIGKAVLVPFGDNKRYDLVIEENGEFERIQCKTGRLKNGCIDFSTCSMIGRKLVKRKSYHGEVESFGVYCPENGKVYIVPIDKVGVKSFRLRVSHTKNNNEKNINWAKDYEVS